MESWLSEHGPWAAQGMGQLSGAHENARKALLLCRR